MDLSIAYVLVIVYYLFYGVQSSKEADELIFSLCPRVQVPDVLGITAASAALALSEVPFPKPVAGVRVAQVEGVLVVNPTKAQQAVATLDLVVAGTKDAVMMVEVEY